MQLTKLRKSDKLINVVLLFMLIVGPGVALSEEYRIYHQPINMESLENTYTWAANESEQKIAEKLRVAKIRSIVHNGLGKLSSLKEEEIVGTIMTVSQQYQLDPLLITAIIEIESHFNNYACSRRGARGLMQVMPNTGKEIARELGIKWEGFGTLYNPVTNIRIGTCYFARLLKSYHEPYKALVAYNQGPGKLNAYLNKGYKLPQYYWRKFNQAVKTQNQLLPIFV